ncbi:hypothetical protein GUITHDRAFT_121453 [Guillardia theta CCMP2712]|uniref:SAM domain-containing protein n=2 Tax=Guillardia theta TaxID=55529 RepID=L1I831_GUITC|nr:hypothetical protein GUITHDRAFT_121453 [Guillardia theta CCMP2712]EKX32373.1 hypothetical protein GUITHDRAFT_121453 [Guillardia theta CCMP2712]|eukprot:XP_005819353.1 hypothetical protein GUITHDRAFT_121453 [Guillardia theta CCMP2712]
MDQRPLPFGARGTWPRCAERPFREVQNGVKGFLDKFCLVDGKDWEAGFVLGLVHSLLFVPMLSFYEELDETTQVKRFTGSLGGLVELGHSDRVDNVLLEYIIAIELCRKEGTHVQSIFPILLSPRRDDGTFSEFLWSSLQLLPEKPSHLTNERAAMILAMLDVEEKQIAQMKQRSIKQTVEMILKHQACKLSDMKQDDQVYDFCARKILDVVLRDIERLQLDPNDFAFKTPGGSEVLQWLKERGLLGLAPMLVKHHVDSLNKAANLTDSDILDIFRSERSKQDEMSCPKGQELSLRLAIADLRKDKRAKPYSQRLLDFRDSATAIGTAVWTTNAIEIVCSKWQGQYMFAVLALVCALIPFFTLGDKLLTTWQSTDYHVVLWFKVVYYLPFWISTSLVLVKSVYEARYVRPHKARATLKAQSFRWNLLFLIGVVAEIAQILAGQHEPGWTVADTLSVNGIAFELMLFLPASMLVYLTFEYREEYWVPSWLMLAIVVSVTYSFIWRAFLWYFMTTVFVAVFTSSLFTYFVVIRIKTIGEARRKLGFNVKRYLEEWSHCLQATSSVDAPDVGRDLNHKGVGRVLHSRRLHPVMSVEPQATRGALEVLWEMTSAIELQLEQQYRSCQARVHPWTRFWQDRNKGFGRFKSKEGERGYGKIRQLSSDLDQLYQQASTINSAVHDLIADLLTPLQHHSGSSHLVNKYPMLVYGPVKQPQRAIEKCVRSYRRDVGCLTDLVRCTIVAESMEQLLQVLHTIRLRSVIGIAPVNRDEDCKLSVDAASQSASESLPAQAGNQSFLSRAQQLVLSSLSSRSRRESEGEKQLELMRGEEQEQEEGGKSERFFRITQVKNRFHSDSHHFNPMTGYRDLSLNLEVGWTFSRNSVIFLPVEEWEQGAVDRYIIEVQIHFKGFYDIMSKAGFHDFYCEWRDIMSR